jgi:hypothetical protein
MAAVAGAPHRADRPAIVAIIVSGRATRRRHHNPAAISPHKIAHEVIRKLVPPRFSHQDVVARTSDSDTLRPTTGDLAKGGIVVWPGADAYVAARPRNADLRVMVHDIDHEEMLAVIPYPLSEIL